jgi:hypothetical protein
MASVSFGKTSTRRTLPLTLIDSKRSTAPAVGWSDEQPPSPPNRNVEDPATAPDAMTPLMNARRDDLVLKTDEAVPPASS